MLLTVLDLEARTQVSRFTWRSWIKQGRVPVVRIGRRVRVAEEDLRKFLAQNRTPAREGN